MPIRLIEETAAGTEVRTRVARDHWAHRLLSRKPNSWQTPHEFIEGMTFAAVLGMGALAIKVRVGKEVRELLPVPPAALRVEQSSDYGVRYVVTFADGTVQHFGQDDVLFFRGPSLDGITAIPAFAKARRAIGLTRAPEEQQANLAENGGRPSGTGRPGRRGGSGSQRCNREAPVMCRPLALFGLLIVAACARAPLEVAPVSVPTSLLTCRDAPAKPAGDYTQRAVGAYVIGLHKAHADCHSKLGAVRGALSK